MSTFVQQKALEPQPGGDGSRPLYFVPNIFGVPAATVGGGTSFGTARECLIWEKQAPTKGERVGEGI